MWRNLVLPNMGQSGVKASFSKMGVGVFKQGERRLGGQKPFPP